MIRRIRCPFAEPDEGEPRPLHTFLLNPQTPWAQHPRQPTKTGGNEHEMGVSDSHKAPPTDVNGYAIPLALAGAI